MVLAPTGLNSKVSELLAKQIDEGKQLGVQVCAYRRGETIVDCQAGTMGPEDPRPVQADSLFSSFSTTKGVAALAVHIAADRGLLEYDDPVAKHWPEFAVQGKQKVTIEQAMSHQTGLHATPDPLMLDFATNWQAGLKWVAGMKPAWEPGTASGYHALTFGWIAGGIIEGATGRPFKDWVRAEIAEPLGVAQEMFIGIPEGVEERLTTLDFSASSGVAAPLPIPDDHDFYKAMPKNSELNFNDMRVRTACLPAANGHLSARALARMYGALANGGEIDGVRLVSKERIAEMNRVVHDWPDRVLFGLLLPRGIGFVMGGKFGEMKAVSGPRRTAFGHNGAGGSTGFADPEVGLSIAVTLNKMGQSATLEPTGPTFQICDLIRDELGVN
jgi:CubicO group peptidase (beta-lactamase class C family)